MSDDKSLEPLFNNDLSDEATATGKRDLRVKNANNPVDGYHPANMEINQGNEATNYYGFLRDDGAYYIQKEVIAGTLTTYTYTKGSSGYSTAWTARTSQTYATFDTTF